MTNTIKKLTPTLIAKIAAGEVVERPASVVKELIENAIDAKATHITITLEKAGQQKIIITDNGHGMNAEDAALAPMAHTTSKITNDADLANINTLGFRGEALSSIAAVSTLSILTRTKGSTLGTEVICKGGALGKAHPAGAPIGTTLTVSTLFAQMPARKKFLKTNTTEFKHVLKVVTNAALASPGIAFTLVHNGKEIFQLPHHQPITERMSILLGRYTAPHFLPLERNFPHIGISGFIGTPQIAMPRNGQQYVFVNGRSVVSPMIAKAVKAAYGTLLDAHTHPAFILSLTVPAESIDVNIHPRKESVQFINENTVREVITKAVQKTLEKGNLTYMMGTDAPNMINDRGMDGYTATTLKEVVKPWSVQEAAERTEAKIEQMHRCYLVTETPKGLLIIDQHAAHERILYEQFKASAQGILNNQKPFTLPEPIVFDLSPLEHETLTDNAQILSDLGFALEQFGKRTIKVRSLPQIFKGRDIPTLIAELLADIASDESPHMHAKVDAMTQRTYTFLACRGAVKAGDYLTEPERKTLLEKLAETPNSFTCPHGRPSQIEISKHQLDSMFKRV